MTSILSHIARSDPSRARCPSYVPHTHEKGKDYWKEDDLHVMKGSLLLLVACALVGTTHGACAWARMQQASRGMAASGTNTDKGTRSPRPSLSKAHVPQWAHFPQTASAAIYCLALRARSQILGPRRMYVLIRVHVRLSALPTSYYVYVQVTCSRRWCGRA